MKTKLGAGCDSPGLLGHSDPVVARDHERVAEQSDLAGVLMPLLKLAAFAALTGLIVLIANIVGG